MGRGHRSVLEHVQVRVPRGLPEGRRGAPSRGPPLLMRLGGWRGGGGGVEEGAAVGAAAGCWTAGARAARAARAVLAAPDRARGGAPEEALQEAPGGALTRWAPPPTPRKCPYEAEGEARAPRRVATPAR